MRILNKRFLPTRKNGWNPPVCPDERLRYVEVECGYCFECRKKKRNAWRVRNYEQLKETPTAVFFTGTVSPERYDYIKTKYDLKTDNEIIIKIHRLFLERIRKQLGKSIKHWCVTEKGHKNTRRVHLHGLFYAPEGMTRFTLINLLRGCWIDGYCYNGKYVNEKTVNYVSKYMTKKDEDNPEYIGKVLCSPGLGKGFVEKNRKYYKMTDKEPREYYTKGNGVRMALPRYYKEKLYTEEERQELWIRREDSGIKYVGTFKIRITDEESLTYYQTLRMQHEEEGIAIHKDDIVEILKKKMANKKTRAYYRKRIRELYGHELRQRQRQDARLCRDLNEFWEIYTREKDMRS